MLSVAGAHTVAAHASNHIGEFSHSLVAEPKEYCQWRTTKSGRGSVTRGEISAVARAMAEAHGEMITAYKEREGIDIHAAAEKAGEPIAERARRPELPADHARRAIGGCEKRTGPQTEAECQLVLVLGVGKV